MNEKMSLFLVPCLLMCVSVCSENILAVLPFYASSHFAAYKPIVEELAHRGHNVTVISPFPPSTVIPRYTHIDVRNITGRPTSVNLQNLDSPKMHIEETLSNIKDTIAGFERVFKDQHILQLFSNNKYDLVMTEIFVSDMFVGLSHKFRAPLISMTSAPVYPWGSDRFGIPDNPSYIGSTFSFKNGEMDFFSRLVNTISLQLGKVLYRYFTMSNDEVINKMCLGEDAPRVEDIIKRTSLLLINSHVSINGARPFPPNAVEIGGVHLKPPKEIPQDLNKFINESEHGVVYFSLGSVANSTSLPESMVSAFCKSFAKIKQRVLWKWDLDLMPGKPDNVQIVKWMPQADILAHPKVCAFISHGGLLSTMEAVYHGVPMIGIPLVGDQFLNVETLVEQSAAEQLTISNITEDSVTAALNAVLNDPKYKMNAQRLSRIFRDRPMSPLDTAIYWIEYVLRHDGAHHLRSAAVDLPWYQYLLLDVIAFILSLFLLSFTLMIYAIKFVFRLICSKKKVKTQ